MRALILLTFKFRYYVIREFKWPNWHTLRYLPTLPHQVAHTHKHVHICVRVLARVPIIRWCQTVTATTSVILSRCSASSFWWRHGSGKARASHAAVGGAEGDHITSTPQTCRVRGTRAVHTQQPWHSNRMSGRL